MIDDPGAQAALRNRRLNKGIELLLGLVTGIIADSQLHDLEIQFLNTWLADHEDVAAVWPGSLIAQRLQATLADGIVTEDERQHLLATLTQMAVTDFANTGSASPEVMALPLDDQCLVALRDANVCLTGEFLFGTRTKCEAISVKAGAVPHGTVTRKTAFLIVGTNVSPHWAHTSYGRKIQQSIELQQDGGSIKIISERRWLDALCCVLQ